MSASPVLILRLFFDFFQTLHSSLSLIPLERSWLINQYIVLACICPCVDVNLTFQLSFVDVLLFVRVVDVLSSIPSNSGTNVLWTYHFRENFLVYIWACIHFPCLSKLNPCVQRFSSSWAFQPYIELIRTKITWRLRNLHNTLYIT